MLQLKHKKNCRNITDITENDEDAILLDKNKPYMPYKQQKL